MFFVIVMHSYTIGDKRKGMALPVTKLNSEITEEEKSCVDAFKSGNKQIAELHTYTQLPSEQSFF